MSKSFEWNVAAARFATVDDPTYDENGQDVATDIYNAGYRREFSSREEDSEGGWITVYRHHEGKEGMPMFFIDISGECSGIASLVARDFPHLVLTLQQLQPLLTLLGLDQVTWNRAIDREAARTSGK